MHKNFYLDKELVPFDHWESADYWTKKVFGWLHDLNLDQAFGIFNLQWGNDAVFQAIPKNYKTYVITPGTEYVDWQWINYFCKSVPDSTVIIVCPYTYLLYAEPNLKLITFDVWPYNLKFTADHFQRFEIQYTDRQYKISSLAKRISQFRSYVCAHLYQTWNSKDYVMSWWNTLDKQEDLYLLDYTGNAQIDKTIDFIKETFWDLKIMPTDVFVNSPFANLNYNWAAYNDCVVNCSNESINNSYQFIDGVHHIQPGPYLTEKTYKVLLSGTALFAVGQYQTYNYLESQGFVFDYPWDRSYDLLPQDIDRIAKSLDCLDIINRIPLRELEEATLTSRMHNREHIFSGDYFKTVDNINYKNIEQFSKAL